MFIRGIVVPVLIICLILFIGVGFNDANANNTNSDNIRNNGTSIDDNSMTNNNDTLNESNITTTPIINRSNMNSNMDASNENDVLTATQLRNELGRINGLGTVYVDVIGNTAYIIKNGDVSLSNSMSIGDVSIREEIIRTVKNISNSINKVCVIDNGDIYNSYNNNSRISNLSQYETTSNLIYIR